VRPVRAGLTRRRREGGAMSTELTERKKKLRDDFI
jgi:hypothetical protein